ncbi:unnamed protein product [Acanthoscelides obtectus]|uniref:Uncharacterized protein n=1 Tax=Acanthoscelides obtectus TaxID=200917 RepID=A0A9P0KVB7_ACAOB|nr:unnamed protein product [Acanthoscelides obtectus]CAK1637728.1 hypothetical protein AOBTE_LOCUS10157 [Acanthoscelides obtectus]
MFPACIKGPRSSSQQQGSAADDISRQTKSIVQLEGNSTYFIKLKLFSILKPGAEPGDCVGGPDTPEISEYQKKF